MTLRLQCKEAFSNHPSLAEMMCCLILCFFPDGLCILLVKSLASILRSQANTANATKIFCRHLGSLSQTPKSIITLYKKKKTKQNVKDVLIFCISAHVKAPVC